MRDERVDELNRQRIATLEPQTRAVAERHITACMDAGIKLLVTHAFRGMDEQAELYAKGRGKPGPVVTNARPGYSWHNHHRAYDVVLIEDGKPVWDRPAAYKKAGDAGRALGLAWGGDFGSIKGDLGHFEYHPGLTLAQARKL